MTVGWFGRAFNYEHKSLSTKTHIVNGNKVLCGYKPHKTMKFQYCASLDSAYFLTYVECEKCKERLLRFPKREKII